MSQEELEEALGDLTDIDGNQIANQPEWMANLGIEYELEIIDYGYLLLITTGRYVDRVPFDDANTNYGPSYVQVNFGMNFESLAGDWYGRVNVQNSFNEDALQEFLVGHKVLLNSKFLKMVIIQDRCLVAISCLGSGIVFRQIIA